MTERKPDPTKPDRRQRGYLVGREAFEAVGAVEGIRPNAASRARADAFDRRGLSAEERRRAIIEAHRPTR